MDKEINHSNVPGVIINYSPATSGSYLGSPCILILPNGEYLVSHDYFGPGTNYDTMELFTSKDQGKTWTNTSTIVGQWWSTLFNHNEDLYVLGTSREYGYPVIRKSIDRGATWTTPLDEQTGKLSTYDRYHCAPVPVVSHQGYIWRAFELSQGPRENWPAQVLSVDASSDLLQSKNWRFSEPFPHHWSQSQWIEGNIVVTPQNTLVNILRSNLRNLPKDRIGYGEDKAAVLHISENGEILNHYKNKDIIDFPGGGVKFTIRFDQVSKRYWSLTTKQTNPIAFRNNLVLISSSNLREWKIESTILYHHDPKTHAFQYVDWQIDADDMIFVSRTAHDDGVGGANNAHDSNYITFHRIEHFRERDTKDMLLN